MRLLTASLAALATQANADAPNVVVDIAPLHSLVAQIMQGVGDPALLLPPGVSPHDYALRPSDARALSDADVVIWMGPGLTPQLAEPIETLATGATVITILDLPGWTTLPFREDARFDDGHDHGDEDEHAHEDHDEHEDHDNHEDHDDGDHEDHDHDEHAEEDHDEHGHDDHDNHADEDHADHGHDDEDHADHGHDDHADHAHGPVDPHAWLNTVNAIRWITDVGGTLADLSPEHADQIIENVLTTRGALNAISVEVGTDLMFVRSDLQDGSIGYIVPHDSLQYFETAYLVPASGAISLTDKSPPGPAHLRDLQEMIAENNITCILTDPHSNPATVDLLTEGTDTRTAQIDPAGTLLEPGPELYGDLMRGVSTALAECLSQE